MAVRGENSLHFATGLDNSGLKRGALDAVGMVQRMASKITRINPFAGLALAAATAFIAISKSAYNLSKEFQHAMKEVETISDATKENFKEMSAEVFKLSTITTDSPVKLAKAYYQIVSAGYDGAKGLKLLEVATKSATAGVTDTMTAADGITTVLNAFKISAEESEHVADVLFQTVKLGKTNFSELASNLSTVAPLAAANGISFEQVSAAVATLTKQGVPTAQAMTQIRSAIIAANEVLEDGWSKSISLQEAFQMIYKSAGGNQSALREMLGRVEAVNGVLGVSGQNAKMAAEDLVSYANVAGVMSREHKTMMTDNTNQWELWGNNIKQKLHGLGEAMLESSSWIAESLNEMMQETEDLIGATAKASVEFDNLRAELEDSNTAFERKKEILEQLKATYPDYLKSLDLSEFKEENWRKVLEGVSSELDKINGKLRTKIELSGYSNRVNEEKDRLSDINEDIEKNESVIYEYFERIQRYAKQHKIPIDIQITDFKNNGYSKSVAKLMQNNKLRKVFVKQMTDMEAASKRLDTFSSMTSDADGGLFAKKDKQLKKVAKTVKILEDETRRFQDSVDWGNLINQSKNTKSLAELQKKLENVSKTGTVLKKEEIANLNAQIAKRQEVVTQLEAIGKVTKKNRNELLKYNKSNNDEIRAAAKARALSLKDVGFKSAGGGKSDKKTFEDVLKSKEEAYKNYELLKKHLGDEYADQEYAQLLKGGENYRAFLLQKLQDFKGHKEEEAAILASAEKNRFRGFGGEKEITGISVPGTIPIKVELTPPNEESINEVSARISALQEQYNNARSEHSRVIIANQIKSEQERLNAMRGVLSEEKSSRQDLYNSINDLTWEQLRSRKKALTIELAEVKKQLKKELLAEKKNVEKIKKLKKKEKDTQEDLNATNKASGQKAQEVVGDVSGGLKDLGDIFSMFGDDETGKVMNQVAGVGEGVAKMFSGDIVGGAMQAITSAISVEVVSDTAEFEKQIDKLQKVIVDLDYTISKSLGNDKLRSRIEGVGQLKQLEKAAMDAQEAEKEARKQIKFLWIKIGDKGKGSGTDPAKLEEFQKKAEDARRKMRELREEINELWVGSDKETIIGRIFEDLEKTDAKVKDFKKSFSSMIRESMEQQFKRDAIEKWVEDYFSKFAQYSDNEGLTEYKTVGKGGVEMTNYSVGDGVYDLRDYEIKELENDYIVGMQNISKKYKLMQDILKQVGAFEEMEKSKKGMVGEISSKITEETGTIIAGISRAKLVELRNMSANSNIHTDQLSAIVKNTSFNKHLTVLPDVVKRLKNIEELLG